MNSSAPETMLPSPFSTFNERARSIREQYMSNLRDAGIAEAARAASLKRQSKNSTPDRARDVKNVLSKILKEPVYQRTTFYRSTFDVTDGHNLFHFRVFLEETQTPTDEISYIEYPNDQRPWLVFASQEQLDTFEQWLFYYETRWDGPISESQIPKFPVGPRKVSILPFPQRIKEESLGVPLMAWYVSQCQGKMWADDRYFFFENDDDAMNFRLRWA